jgi:hypothetical protein
MLLSHYTKIKPNNIQQMVSLFYKCTYLAGGGGIKVGRDSVWYFSQSKSLICLEKRKHTLFYGW